MKIEEQATSLSLFGIFLSDRPIRMAAVLVSSFRLPQFNRKTLFPPVAKEFGFADVIGNPMGFARNVGIDIKDFLSVIAMGNPMGFGRNVGLDIKDFLSVPTKGILQVFDSSGIIGNTLGFARNVGLGIKDFLSVPAKGILQSPTGLIAGMTQSTTSLHSNTVYAISDAATQFSKTAHKSIVAFIFDDQATAKMEKQLKSIASHINGVLNELLEVHLSIQ
ncbi:hypothetical protein HHK36_001942 [Tetracentron sinense]|uniref:Uncharacterized protein n=1 Tax=Tetracentron sinense TaxID=13715 RepID=A0A835A3M0_TETSI|nr:hypothetical protein HHK36_001942 [Tetracentron sinense]